MLASALLLGVTAGHVIWGFKLFIYFSSWLCCPLWFQGSPQTRQWECFLVFGNLSFLRFPSRDGSLSQCLLSLFLSFIFFPTSFWRQWAAFLGAWCSLPEFRSWFCGIYSAFKCSFDEFVGEKVVSPSYSSTVLGPPLHWLYRLIWGEFTSYYWVF